MVIVPAEEKKENSVGLYIILGLLIAASAAIFVLTRFGINLPVIPGLFPEGTIVKVAERKGISDIKKIDTSIFKNPVFQGLKVYGDFPVKVEKAGRSNPFIPY